MTRSLRLALAGLAIVASACATRPAAPDLGARLAATPAELTLGGGTLRVVNMYKPEAAALRDTAGRSQAEIVDRLVRDVYAPWHAFWNGYLGDEADFREWASKLLAPGHPIHHTLPALLEADIDSLFTSSAEWLQRATGRTPRGTWYLVYGPGWTDMGGLGALGMVADFTKQSTDREKLAFILPHELTHQVQGARPADPDAGTVLDRTVSEGLAVYVAWVRSGRRGSPAAALGYTEEEWTWSLAHERELQAAIAPLFPSRERADLDRIAARGEHVLPGDAGAAGYFTGLRIVQAWAARHGEDRWPDLMDMPVRAVLEQSGYAP